MKNLPRIASLLLLGHLLALPLVFAWHSTSHEANEIIYSEVGFLDDSDCQLCDLFHSLSATDNLTSGTIVRSPNIVWYPDSTMINYGLVLSPFQERGPPAV